MRLNLYLMSVTVIYLQSAIVAEPIKCVPEELEYAPGRSSQFCVFRGVHWRAGAPEPDFQSSAEMQVAFVDSNLTAIPESFYERFPRLNVLVANNVSLQKLKIKNAMKIVYAEQNNIKQVDIDGGEFMKELHLKDNPISNISSITKSRSLEVLDLSGTTIPESESNTIDFATFAKMENLTELYLSNREAHYIENDRKVTLPKLKLLDLSSNPIIPVNFNLQVFSRLPNLEELSLRRAMMSDITVSNMRRNFPMLKRIDIAGNDFPCPLLKALLEHLKESGIEVMSAASPNPEQCFLGYEVIDNLCCKADINYDIDTKPVTSSTTPSTSTTTETSKTPDVVTPKHGSDSQSTEDGSSLTVILISVIAVIVLLAVAAGVGIYLKRRSQDTHKAVPRNDPSDNL